MFPNGGSAQGGPGHPDQDFIMNLRLPWQQDHVVGLFYNYEIDIKLFRGNIFCVRIISIMKISCNMVE